MAYNNVYSFFSADSKVGVTMLITSIAEVLSNGNKVLIINANKRLGLDYISQESEVNSLDELLNKLESDILEYEDLDKIIIKKGNLHIIAGIRDIEKCRHFKPDYINKILDYVHERYDVILIDCGSDFEFSGLSIGALKATKNSVLVVTQQEKTWNELQRVILLSEKLNIQYKEIIVNKLQPRGSGLVSPKRIQEYTNIENILGEVPHSMYSWQAETDYKTLSHFDSAFKREIENISRIIASELTLRMVNERKKRFGLFRRQ